MITLTREEAQQVLDALEDITRHFGFKRLGESRLADTEKRGAAHKAIETLRARLAEPAKEQEPVAWMMVDDKLMPIYTAPQKREWQGLTDEEIYSCAGGLIVGGVEFARAIEAKLKEKNK